MAEHMYKVYRDQKFTSYDFGELNTEILGQTETIDFLKHFDKIDIPITYYVSLQDHLCRPDDVMVQYLELQKHNPDLAALKVFDGYSHIDFTYLNHHTMVTEVMKTLLSFN